MSNPTDIAEENKARARECLNHLDALIGNVHFEWFRAAVLAKARDDERDAALSTANEHRSRAVWRHDLAKTLCEEPERLRRMHARTAGLPEGG